jgi:hypothetical protein
MKISFCTLCSSVLTFFLFARYQKGVDITATVPEDFQQAYIKEHEYQQVFQFASVPMVSFLLPSDAFQVTFARVFMLFVCLYINRP